MYLHELFVSHARVAVGKYVNDIYRNNKDKFCLKYSLKYILIEIFYVVRYHVVDKLRSTAALVTV